jgi:hypothetical protein
MNNDKFLIVIEIKKFIFSLDKILINYPKSDIIIKKDIFNESVKLLELAYLANNSVDNKLSYQNKMLVSISMLDFYFDYSFKKKYISLKALNNKINHLTKINKMVYGWMKSNEL